MYSFILKLSNFYFKIFREEGPNAIAETAITKGNGYTIPFLHQQSKIMKLLQFVLGLESEQAEVNDGLKLLPLLQYQNQRNSKIINS